MLRHTCQDIHVYLDLVEIDAASTKHEHAHISAPSILVASSHIDEGKVIPQPPNFSHKHHMLFAQTSDTAPLMRRSNVCQFDC